MKKTAIISEWAPPVVEGGPVLLGRLLRRLPRGSYFVLCRRPEEHRSAIDPSGFLDCQYFFFHVPQLRGTGRLRRNINRLLVYLFVPLITLKGLWVSNAEKADNILTTSMGEGAIIAAYFVSIIGRKPLFVYCFDAWGELVTNHVDRLMARLFERRILRHAAKVFVLNEAHREFYLREHGLDTAVLPQSVDRSLYVEAGSPDASGSRQSRDAEREAGIHPSPPQEPRTSRLRRDPDASGNADGHGLREKREAGSGEWQSTINGQKSAISEREHRIVFTGVIYSPQFDSVKRLADVVNSMENVRLVLYTPNSPQELAAAGVGGRNVEYGFVKAADVPRVQQEADVLFLPMGFNGAKPSLIATASPSKMPEYLAAGRPILVNAPAYSYVASYARKHGFGLVVDEPDGDKLKEAVLLLQRDQSLRQRLVANARALAQRHDLEAVSGVLKEYLL